MFSSLECVEKCPIASAWAMSAARSAAGTNASDGSSCAGATPPAASTARAHCGDVRVELGDHAGEHLGVEVDVGDRVEHGAVGERVDLVARRSPTLRAGLAPTATARSSVQDQVLERGRLGRLAAHADGGAANALAVVRTGCRTYSSSPRRFGRLGRSGRSASGCSAVDQRGQAARAYPRRVALGAHGQQRGVVLGRAAVEALLRDVGRPSSRR